VEVRNASILASDGKALVVAMVHARAYGAIEGLKGPDAAIEAAVDAGADAVITTFGSRILSTTVVRSRTR
jgi:DhnA family fructose-bisphosphate aldolase class Ia